MLHMHAGVPGRKTAAYHDLMPKRRPARVPKTQPTMMMHVSSAAFSMTCNVVMVVITCHLAN